MGTLRYMSPEQMRGDRHVLDHHTDIYSLGATLYEMLTLQPAFPDSDAARLMQRIAIDEPMSPRQLNPAIPRDLETIVLKAMAKDHEDRYTTAGEMAADLRRFLNDEPILAEPPGAIERTRKWARRHRSVVSTAAATLLVAVVMAGSLLWNERHDTLAALDRETVQKKRAEEQEALAVAAKKESERNLAAALDAVDKLLEHASDPKLAEIPKIQPVRKRILDDALAFYNQFKVTSGDSPGLRHRAARAHTRLAALAKSLGDYELAIRAYENAIEMLQELKAEFPDNVAYRVTLANDYLALGWVEGNKRRSFETALDCFNSAKKERERLAEIDLARQETHRLRAVKAMASMARTYQKMGNDEKFRDIIRDAHDRINQLDPALDDFSTLIDMKQSFAESVESTDPTRAESLWLEAVELSRNRWQMTSTRGDGYTHAWALQHAADFFANHDVDRARHLLDEAIELSAKLVRDFPGLTGYRTLLQTATSRQVKLLRAVHMSAEERSRMIADYLERFPDLQFAHQIHAEYLAQGDHPLDKLAQAIEEHPEQGPYYHCRGLIYCDQGQFNLALADLDQAINLGDDGPSTLQTRGEICLQVGEYEKALDDFNAYLKIWNLGHIYKRRAAANFGLGRYAEALADLNTLLDMKPDDGSAMTWISPSQVAACPDAEFRQGMIHLADRAIELTKGSINAYINAAYIEAALRENKRADTSLSAALALVEKALANPNIERTKQKTQLALELNNLAWFLVTASDSSIWEPERAVKLATKVVDLQPENGMYWNTLGVAQYRAGDYASAIESLTKSVQLPRGEGAFNYLFLAMSHGRLGDHQKARQWYDKSVQLMSDQNVTAGDLLRLRAEAESVLGDVSTRPAPEDDEEPACSEDQERDSGDES